MAYHLMRPVVEEMGDAGFEHLAAIPFVMHDSWAYEREASRYLRERAMGLAFHLGASSVVPARRKPTKTSVTNFGGALINFLEWCEARGKNWRTVEYSALLDEYQAEMERGSWSASGRRLAASTQNLRVGEAVYYLSWAALRELRPAFLVPVEVRKVQAPSHKNAWGHEARDVAVRAGRVRPDPKTLRLPSDAKVKQWRAAVVARQGPTKALMVDLVLQTGIRRAECAEWRVDTLPLLRENWNITADRVVVTIRYGAKGGPKYSDKFGDEAGPPRNIEMPLGLAERIHAYREFKRKANRSTYVRSGTTAAEQARRRAEREPRLFLSDFDGTPVRAHTLYDAWANVRPIPFLGWTVHLGRDWWACKTLLTAVAREAVAANLSRSEPLGVGWMRGAATDAIRMEIQPQLGHVDEKTTELYLQWVINSFDRGVLDDTYQASLEQVCEEILSENRHD